MARVSRPDEGHHSFHRPGRPLLRPVCRVDPVSGLHTGRLSGQEGVTRSEYPLLYNGGSAVAGPDGRWIVEPVAEEEKLVTADIDPAVVRGERQNFDPAGHYFRGDVIRVEVDRSRLDPVSFAD